MITIIDTIRGISEWIEENFGEPPTTKDIQEAFDRPGTFVQPVSLTASKESELRVEEYSIEITRFAERTYDGYLELLNYQKTFVELLEEPIPVTDTFFLYPEEVQFELDRDDMYLLVIFDLNNIQYVEDKSDALNMEILELEQKEDGD